MKDINDIDNREELELLINDTESKIHDLKNYLVELESMLEEDDRFNEKMEADINSNRY